MVMEARDSASELSYTSVNPEIRGVTPDLHQHMWDQDLAQGIITFLHARFAQHEVESSPKLRLTSGWLWNFSL